MQRLNYIFISLLFLNCASYQTPYDRTEDYSGLKYSESVNILADLDVLDGKQAGDILGVEGRFYALYYPISSQLTSQRLDSLLSSNNPKLKVMGLLCISMSSDSTERTRLSLHYADTTNVSVVIAGCTTDTYSVGNIAKELFDHPYLFGHGPKDDPYDWKTVHSK